MDVKLYDLGNLNEKDRPFLLNDNELSLSENIMKDINGNLVTRSGFKQKATLPSKVIEVVYYRSKNEFVVFSNPSDLHLRIDIYNGDTFALKRTYAHTGQTGQRLITQFQDVGQISEINFDEYQNNIYFIYIVNDNPAPMLKYDGYVIRSTGLPTCRILSTTGAAGTSYFRSFYKSTDYNGNITYGPYYQQISGNSGQTNIQFDIIPNEFIGCQSHLKTIGASYTLNSSNRTISYQNCSYVANDFVYFSKSLGSVSTVNIVSPKNKDYLILEVESVNTGTAEITFKSSSFTNSEEITLAPNSVISMFHIAIASSQAQDFGYQFISGTNVSGQISCSDLVFFPINSSSPTNNIVSFSNKLIEMEVIYDTTTFKYRPPLCKYVASYGDQLVFGSIVGIWANTDSSNYDQFIPYNNNDLIMYSDISDGDSGENISRTNRQLIGESFNGSVTGMVRVRDSLIVTKQNAIFSIDGQLYSGGYSLRKIETDNIGCSSIKSFLQVTGGVTFQGNDGLYFMNSYVAKKITEKLDPFFSTVDITKTRSAISFKKDQHIYYVNRVDGDYFLVFDYNYKMWFKWKNLDASKLLSSKPDGTVFMSNGSSINELGGLSTDNGTAIVSKIRTKFLDLGEQALIKKFVKCRVLYMVGGGNLSVSVYRDWGDTPTLSDTPLVMDIRTKHKYIPLTNGYSCAIELTNTTSNMIISGLIVTIEPWQASDRNY